jgi:hypothetical protein
MSWKQMLADPKDHLKVVFDSSTPLVVIETVEEQRAMNLIRAAAAAVSLPVFEWSVSDGLFRSGSAADGRLEQVNARLAEKDLPALSTAPALVTGREQFSRENAPQPLYNTKDAANMLAHLETVTVEAVYVLKDMHRQLEDPVVVRLLREVAQAFSSDRRTLVLTAPAFHVPPEIANLAEYIELPLPDRARLRRMIDQVFQRLAQTRTLQARLDPPGLEAMAANLCGLTWEEAERAIAQTIVARYGLLPESVADALEAKRDLLRRSGLLEFLDTDRDLGQLGGMDNLKEWLRKRRAAFDPRARAAGLEPPRGVIILGVQGCGKSLCCRCIAGEWRLPLVKFDASSIFDKYVGETEKRVQKMFRVAEQLAPCILWIDELEKVFAGSAADSASADAGTSARLLGAFLSWMQDRKAPVFVAATSNNVNVLPPELIRKGRFDEIFFVDLPTPEERKAIFRVQLERRKFDLSKFDLDRLAAASYLYSGAEIDAALQAAMYASFADQIPVTDELILRELFNTIPLSTSRAEDILRLREWARHRAVPASPPPEPIAEVANA